MSVIHHESPALNLMKALKIASMALVAGTALLGCQSDEARAKANRARIAAAKQALSISAGALDKASGSRRSPVASLALKKLLPKKVAGLRLRSDVGVTFEAGSKAIVVEALYGFKPPNAKILLIDVATKKKMAKLVKTKSEEYPRAPGGRIIQRWNKSAEEGALTYAADGSFVVQISGKGIDPGELRKALDAIDLERFKKLTLAKN